MTSQAKQLFDRFFAFLRPDFSSHANNKKTALVFVQRNQDENRFRPYIDQTAVIFEGIGLPVVDTVICSGLGAPGEATKDKQALDKANTIRVRSKINWYFQVPRRSHGKAREGRIAGLFNRRATQAGEMVRHLKMPSYF